MFASRAQRWPSPSSPSGRSAKAKHRDDPDERPQREGPERHSPGGRARWIEEADAEDRDAGQVNPAATWTDRAEPAVPAARARRPPRELRGVGDDRQPPHDRRPQRRPAPARRRAARRGAPTGRAGHRDDRRRRPPVAVREGARDHAADRAPTRRPRTPRDSRSPDRERRPPRTTPRGTAAPTSTSRTAPTCDRGSRCWPAGPTARGSAAAAIDGAEPRRAGRRAARSGPGIATTGRRRRRELAAATSARHRRRRTRRARRTGTAARSPPSTPRSAPRPRGPARAGTSRRQLQRHRVHGGERDARRNRQGTTSRPSRERPRSRVCSRRDARPEHEHRPAGTRPGPGSARASAPAANPSWTATVSSGGRASTSPTRRRGSARPPRAEPRAPSRAAPRRQPPPAGPTGRPGPQARSPSLTAASCTRGIHRGGLRCHRPDERRSAAW